MAGGGIGKDERFQVRFGKRGTVSGSFPHISIEKKANPFSPKRVFMFPALRLLCRPTVTLQCSPVTKRTCFFAFFCPRFCPHAN